MNIVDGRNKSTQTLFGDLPVGATFIIMGKLYIKLIDDVNANHNTFSISENELKYVGNYTSTDWVGCTITINKNYDNPNKLKELNE